MYYLCLLLLNLVYLTYGQDISNEIPMNSAVPRRMPVAEAMMKAIGPIAFGKKDGDDVKWDVPHFGKVGLGNGKMQMLKFVPCESLNVHDSRNTGTDDEIPNAGTWTLGDRPNLGYMEHESTLGRSAGSSTRMNLGGIGQFVAENNQERGTGLLDFSKALFPFLELPPPKNEEKHPHSLLSPEEQRWAEIYYPKPRSYLNERDSDLTPPPLPFEEISPEKRIQKLEDDQSFSNPFDQIKSRPGYARFRAMASKTLVEDSDLLPTKPDNPFLKEAGVAPQLETNAEKDQSPVNTIDIGKRAKTSDVPIPISELGLSEKQIYEICAKFSPVAAKHCYVNKIDPQFLARCRGYASDCAKFQAQAKPLGALANSWSSGVGLTYYNWGVKGIPYYPINEEGAIGNGRNGKVDFGTWGGGYSDELGVRDFWSQTQEYGANWYEGMYGWKQGWSVPIIQSLGVEGASGTMVNVPLKEGSLGRPISVTNSYSVGPYLGLAEKVGVDWYNGGVNLQRGFSVPLVGVGVSTGVGVGFPSIGTMINRMGLNGIQANPQLFSTSSGFDSSIGLSGKQESSLSATNNGQPLLGNLIALAEMAKKKNKNY